MERRLPGQDDRGVVDTHPGKIIGIVGYYNMLVERITKIGSTLSLLVGVYE